MIEVWHSLAREYNEIVLTGIFRKRTFGEFVGILATI
jgi:hypothetical protein